MYSKSIILAYLFCIFVLIFQVHQSNGKEVELPVPYRERDWIDCRESLANEILNEYLDNKSGKEPMFYSNDIAAQSLVLLGRPAISVIFDSYRKNSDAKKPCGNKVSDLLSCYALRSKLVSSINFNDKEINKLEKLLLEETSFPANQQMDALKPGEVEKILREASKINSKESHRIGLWYLSNLEKQIKDGKITPTQYASNLLKISQRMDLNPVPEAAPILLDKAINACSGDFRLQSLRKDCINYISDIYHSTFTGLIHMAIVDEYTNNSEIWESYISTAVKPSADLDQRLIEKIMQNEKIKNRDVIAEYLGRSGNRSYRKILLPLLKHDNKKIRYGAARGLAFLGDDSGISLIEANLNEKDISSTQEMTIIEALGKLGTDKACDIMCKWLKNYLYERKQQFYTNFYEVFKDTCNPKMIEKLSALHSENGTVNEEVEKLIKYISN
jgi:hypothetical protein